MFRNLIRRIKVKISSATPERYANYLRSKGAVIGEHCTIHPGAGFGSEPYLIEIGDHVTLNGSVQLLTHDGGVEVLMDLGYCQRPDKFGRIRVGNNVFVGANAIVLPGVTIGSNVIIGAGAVVSRDVPDNVVAAGVPARVICTIDEFYQKNRDKILETKYMSSGEKRTILTQMMEEGKL